MEKNTIVLDEFGNVVGQTYPKRARGLVKNGRAEYLDDCTIRLKESCNPAINESDMEEEDMSIVLNFNAREFQFDKTCQGNNVGTRMFVTDIFGESVEMYEIGGGMSWTQICTDKILEPDTDYVFRFAMTGGNDVHGGATQFIVMPIAGEEGTDEDWENRYVYNLSQCQYKPKVSKRWGNTALRVYEIPFKTEATVKYRFIFVEQDAVLRIFPSKDLESYSQFSDYSYNGWLNDKKDQINEQLNNFNVDQTMKGVSDTVRSAMDKINKAIFSNINFGGGQTQASQENKFVHNGKDIDGNELAVMLNSVGDGCNIVFANCNVTDVENAIDGGTPTCGSNIRVSNTKMDGKAFCACLDKIGDGCSIGISNIAIAAVEELPEGTNVTTDGCNVEISNATMPEAIFAFWMANVGDGWNIRLTNVEIAEDGSDLSFGNHSVGSNITFTNVAISENARQKVKEKFAEGNVNGL